MVRDVSVEEIADMVNRMISSSMEMVMTETLALWKFPMKSTRGYQTAEKRLR